ncbi:tRNA uridine-5-carboxymethylaminomethyl(34) synthesis GTPase MnmE [Comamonas serinivorans]|uniref:tRNA modification GTPase MnmE n=1 Tax=Comamonas serinivorans TaxID=1082851 RepID=A0A1Y0EI92_9BURK|nr:tRNA uridine-5-carboxymethylaminomethyl(34) synthesis GTPase MnmE [Comamonas serinivorans]ARU03315.1 tRNA uridine-5-carboxymethylaminomethyl(34) synthesis GTPase MnmE [Comamonas serinivorans]
MSLAQQQAPIVAVTTAPGKGAVGVVRVSGRDLSGLIAALCGRSLRAREATYGPFRDAGGEAIDHGLAIHFPAPHSYTGEDVLELQAHGGPVVLQLLLTRCLAVAQALAAQDARHPLAGLRLAQPGEFTQRAFLNDKLDLAQAEAIADLIDASTEQAARSATRSLAGAFSQQVHGLRDHLIALRTLVEATLDFPEEEIDFIEAYGVRDTLGGLLAELDGLQRQTRQGALLREGMQVVIAGQPNVGKSSLLNALAGEELAIVTSIAGTTRDVVRQSIQIEGVPLHVIDTAGLRGAHEGEADAVEAIGMQRAWSQIERADAVLFLHDLTRQHDAAHRAHDARIGTELTQRLPRQVPVVHVWNKADAADPAAQAQGAAEHTSGIHQPALETQPQPDPAAQPAEQLAHTTTVGAAQASEATALTGHHLRLSAKTGAGLTELRQLLLRLVGWEKQAEGVFIARARHVQALDAVHGHLLRAAEHVQPQAVMLDLMAEELRLAQQALASITGEFTADDLLGSIFSTFCIGK